ncbi:MAG TPA: CPBP family glutamic-type intramembrane protease [Blastocatellia bacterium]|nr:CPBP family glutamic-type intramembrane protease [Blastocatellia bacterium]
MNASRFRNLYVPSFVLRRSGATEALGASPSLWEALAYSIIVLSVSGIFLGIIWARTKRLRALVLIHAATDLLPNLAEFANVASVKN